MKDVAQMDDFKHTHQMLDRQAEQRPDAVAVIDGDGRAVTWAQYAALSRSKANQLAVAGIAAGDRVMIVAENCLEVAVVLMACSRIGAIAVPVNARMSAAELARIQAHADPKLVLYTIGASKEAAAHADAAGARPEPCGCGALYGQSFAAGAAEPLAGTAVLLYTTGTTGDPKGVMLSHGNLIFAARASATLRDLTPADRVYGALPLTHVFGLASMLMASAFAGATVQLAARFSAEALYEALRAGATVVPAVPQMHALLMAYAAEHGHRTLGSDRLRYVSSGAAPLDPAWKRKAEAFYGIPLQNGYGMTESTAGVSGTRNAIGDPDTSVGPPLPGVEVRLDTSVGNAEGVGEVQTRGPHVMQGYFRNPSATADAMTGDGFLRTGDLGRIDDAGRLHIVGRAKELIIRGGFNVYPPEVEAALNDHPAVVQCAVIGRARDGNEEVLAFVQCRGSVTPDELRDFAARTLSAYKRPSRIYIVDVLPAAATGKILKHKLLSHFAGLLSD